MGIELAQNTIKYYRPVSEFYDGKSVFITGATGFLGKMLLERLVWNCPKLNQIYILVREKNGLSVEKRVETLLDNILFKNSKQNRPDYLNKVIPITGDIGLDNLGIDYADEEKLIEKVNIVIHTAATIRFNEPLKQALRINLEGTDQILSLCHRMKHLELFVHTSTAYTNSDKTIIEEIIYPATVNLTDVYRQVENNELKADFTKFLNNHPNTYAFTKALTENLITEKHGKLTTIIIRPSIVTAAASGPQPGWLDNWNGATALLISIGKGLNRILWGNINNVIDFIPVDFVANFILVAIAKGQRPRRLVVYNCCSSSSNPLTYKELLLKFTRDAVKYRSYIFPFPQLYFMTNQKVFATIVTVFLQILPAFIADIICWILGKPTGFLRLQKRLISKRESLKYFTTNSWLIRNAAARALYSSLSAADKNQFPCDATQLNWSEYIPIYGAGIRRYLEKK